MAKNIIPDPSKLSLRVRNNSDKRYYVMVTPSEDYKFIELITGFAQLASGIYGLAGSAADLAFIVRTISFAKDSRGLIDKLRNEFPKIARTIGPRREENVFDFYTERPDFFLNPSSIFNLFGGHGFSILVVDENFTQCVLFNTPLDKTYQITDYGVGNHPWNHGGIATGLQSSASPGIGLVNNELLMTYRHVKGNAIFMAKFENGNFVKYGSGSLHFDTKEGVGIAERQGEYILAARDPDGDQMFTLWHRPGSPLDSPGKTWMGRDIEGRPSITTLRSLDDREWTLAVGKHTDPGNAAFWMLIDSEWKIKHGNSGWNTRFPPAVVAFYGAFFMAFVDVNTGRIKITYTKHFDRWSSATDLGVTTSAGPALTVYQDKLFIFYRDIKGNAVFYAYSEDGHRFQNLGENDNKNTGLDIQGEPAACPLPGGNNGIMIAGRIPLQGTFIMPWQDPEGIAIVILNPVLKQKTVSASVKKKTTVKKKKIVSAKKKATVRKKKIVSAKKKTAEKVKPKQNKKVTVKKAAKKTVAKRNIVVKKKAAKKKIGSKKVVKKKSSLPKRKSSNKKK